MKEQVYWTALGLSPGASADAIKAAYRQIARENHPDKNPGDTGATERFRAAAEAYRALMDMQRSSPTPERNPSASDLFGHVFGFRKGGQPEKGADTRYTYHLSFVDAAIGGEQQLQVPGKVICTHCDGSGGEPGASFQQCSECQGEGTVARKRGFFETQVRCPKCDGKGVLVETPCSVCMGSALMDIMHEVSITLNPGVTSGTRIKLRGLGYPGRAGGSPGDLYILLDVGTHPIFTRQGRNLLVDAPIPFSLAALGGSIPIPTLNGCAELVVPAGTTSGQTFTLRNKGIAGGDLHVTVHIEVPQTLSNEAQKHLKAYAELEGREAALPKTESYLRSLPALNPEEDSILGSPR